MCFPVASTDQAGAAAATVIEQPESITSLDPVLPAAGNAPTATGGAVESAEPDPRPTGTAGGATGGFFSQSRVIETGVAGTLLANPITLEKLQTSLLIAAPGSREAERSPLTALSDDTGGRFFDSDLGDEQRSAITRVFEGVGLRAPEFGDEGFLTQLFQQQQLPGFLSFLDDVRAEEGRNPADIEGIDRTQLGFTTEEIVEDFGGVRELLSGFDTDFVPGQNIRDAVNEAIGFDATESLRPPREIVPGASEPGIDREEEFDRERDIERNQEEFDRIRDELNFDSPQTVIDALAAGATTEFDVIRQALQLGSGRTINDYLESVGLSALDLAPITAFEDQAQFIADALRVIDERFTGSEFLPIFPIVSAGEGQRSFDQLFFLDPLDRFLFQTTINTQEFKDSELGQFFDEARSLVGRLFGNFGENPPQEQIDFVNEFIQSGLEDFGANFGEVQEPPVPGEEPPTPGEEPPPPGEEPPGEPPPPGGEPPPGEEPGGEPPPSGEEPPAPGPDAINGVNPPEAGTSGDGFDSFGTPRRIGANLIGSGDTIEEQRQFFIDSGATISEIDLSAEELASLSNEEFYNALYDAIGETAPSYTGPTTDFAAQDPIWSRRTDDPTEPEPPTPTDDLPPVTDTEGPGLVVDENGDVTLSLSGIWSDDNSNRVWLNDPQRVQLAKDHLLDNPEQFDFDLRELEAIEALSLEAFRALILEGF